LIKHVPTTAVSASVVPMNTHQQSRDFKESCLVVTRLINHCFIPSIRRFINTVFEIIYYLSKHMTIIVTGVIFT